MRTLILLALIGLLLACAGMTPGAKNWGRSDVTRAQRDAIWQACVNRHVWEKGAQEGITHTRDYRYNATAAVWDCMASEGYAWVPDIGLDGFVKAGSTPREKTEVYDACFQRDPSFASWNGPSQKQTLINLKQCMESRGYQWNGH